MNVYKRLPIYVIQKAPGLLPMLYTLPELSAILNVHPRTLHDWLALGIPYQRLGKGRIWVNGQGFAQWVNEMRPRKTKTKMAHDEGWCFKCRKAVKIKDGIRHLKGSHTMIKGICPDCGSKINRGGKRSD